MQELVLPLGIELKVELTDVVHAREMLRQASIVSKPPFTYGLVSLAMNRHIISSMLPDKEWLSPHDHRRVLAELVLASVILERGRILMERGFRVLGTEYAKTDPWIGTDADGTIVVRRDWLTPLLRGLRDRPEQDMPPATGPLGEVRVSLEVLAILLESPAAVSANIWVILTTGAALLSAANDSMDMVSKVWSNLPHEPAITCTIERYQPPTQVVDLTPPQVQLRDQLSAQMSVEDRDAALKAVQRNLKNLGCDPGPIDGRWGPKTDQAAQAFAKKYGAELAAWENRVFQARLAEVAAMFYSRGK